MDEQALLNKIALLEFSNDQLLSELKQLHELLMLIGFDDGLKGLKQAAKEILEQS